MCLKSNYFYLEQTKLLSSIWINFRSVTVVTLRYVYNTIKYYWFRNLNSAIIYQPVHQHTYSEDTFLYNQNIVGVLKTAPPKKGDDSLGTSSWIFYLFQMVKFLRPTVYSRTVHTQAHSRMHPKKKTRFEECYDVNSWREPTFRIFFPKLASRLVFSHARINILKYLWTSVSDETNLTSKDLQVVALNTGTFMN